MRWQPVGTISGAAGQAGDQGGNWAAHANTQVTPARVQPPPPPAVPITGTTVPPRPPDTASNDDRSHAYAAAPSSQVQDRKSVV